MKTAREPLVLAVAVVGGLVPGRSTVDRPGVPRDADREPRRAERGEAIETQRPLAVQQGEVGEVGAADQELREVCGAHRSR